MPSHINNLFARDHDEAQLSQTIINLLVALLVLLVISICMCGALLFFRHRRRSQKVHHGLPMYNDNGKRISAGSIASSFRRSFGKNSESIYVIQEKQNLIDNSEEPRRNSGIPEIRLTFPEEYDSDGKRTSGRCVVVRVSESGVGLEPIQEKCPAYKSSEGERFQSLDLDRVGGLTEKADQKQWS
jgi:hypothetical protein